MKPIYRVFLTLIIVSFLSNLNAQISSIDWGQEDKGKRAIWGIKSLGWNNDNYYTIHSRSNSLGKYVFFLEKFR